MAGPHAPDVRAVDLRLRLFRRRQDAELHDERRILHDLEFRVLGAREARVKPVRVRGVERRPFAAARRLEDDLPRADETDVRLDRLLSELEISRRPGDAAVGPDPEPHRRLAVALAGASLRRVVVEGDKRVEGLDLAVRAKENRAFGPRAEATGVDVARRRQLVAVDGLERLNPLAESTRRPRKVERVHIFDRPIRGENRAGGRYEKRIAKHHNLTPFLIYGRPAFSGRPNADAASLLLALRGKENTTGRRSQSC